jgi:LmbE family N-acetylglucosaminyl deacetylase
MAIAEPHLTGQDTLSETFLNALIDHDRARIIADNVAVIIAHPDDETIGCGGQLHRLVNVTVVLVTSGAPRDGSRIGTDEGLSPVDLAATRTSELCNALALANVPKSRIIELGFFDQAAAIHLTDLVRAIYCLVAARDIRIVLTHAFEGGHPDHDATAFAVHAAAVLRRRHGEQLAVIEMPFYHAEDNRWATQRFSACPERPAITIRLNASERNRKRSMLAAHATQSTTLSMFDAQFECFRPAPAYDFLALPNGGRLLYEQHDWGMDRRRWLALSRAALEELGLLDVRWF